MNNSIFVHHAANKWRLSTTPGAFSAMRRLVSKTVDFVAPTMLNCNKIVAAPTAGDLSLVPNCCRGNRPCRLTKSNTTSYSQYMQRRSPSA